MDPGDITLYGRGDFPRGRGHESMQTSSLSSVSGVIHFRSAHLILNPLSNISLLNSPIPLTAWACIGVFPKLGHHGPLNFNSRMYRAGKEIYQIAFC